MRLKTAESSNNMQLRTLIAVNLLQRANASENAVFVRGVCRRVCVGKLE